MCLESIYNVSNVIIRNVNEQDLDRCFEIESVSYSGDEAATKEKILKRINAYPEGFIILENDREIIGFINSGATHEVDLSNEDFKDLICHDVEGKYIVILSVVVHPTYQGKGMASTLMNSFIDRMRALGKTSIYLICQTQLIDMYARFGFIDLGISDSDHGGMSWNEMSLSLQELS